METGKRFRIGAVHALLNSIEPTQAAFERLWPAADVAHLLDGSLYLDRSLGTAVEAEIASRIERLIRYSADAGSRGILFTGSFFGDAVRMARQSVDVPVLTSFDGLIASALELHRPLHLIATAPDSLSLLTTELEGEAKRRSHPITVSGKAVAGAMAALLAGDSFLHDRLILDEVLRADPSTAVVFAQFSMERALEQCASVAQVTVVGPASAGVTHLYRML